MITLGVGDLPRATDFYEAGLGFPRVDFASDTVAFFSLNGSWLGLYPREALAEDAMVPDEGSGFDGITLAHNVASEAEVDAVIDRRLPPARPWPNRRRKFSGAVTRAISRTRTDTFGRLPTTHSCGSDRKDA